MADKKIKFAIITRTKNRPDFLARAISSVDEQTYGNYEHLIFNDGGDTTSVDKLVKKSNNKNRHVIHGKKSKGLVGALNEAIKSTEAEFITILDDDDTWHKDRLKVVADYISRTGAKAVAVKMDIIFEEVDSHGKIKFVSQSLHPESGDGEISIYKQCSKNYLSNAVLVYHRSLYDKLGGYDGSLPTAEDWDFGIRILLETDVPLIKTKDSLSYYHQRPMQRGVLGNSVHDGVSTQEETINALRNKYLREDIKKGLFGVGYIMNQSVFDLNNVVRLESHMNYVEKRLKEKTDQALNKQKLLKIILNKFRR